MRYVLVQRDSWPMGEPKCLLHREGCRDIPRETGDLWLDTFEADTADAAVALAIAGAFAFDGDVRVMPCA